MALEPTSMFITRGITFTLICTMAVVITTSEPLNPLSDAFIELINKEGKWQAGRNFPPDTPMEYIKDLLGVKDVNLQYSDYDNVPFIEHDLEVIQDLPESFDPRDKWPNCPSLNEIRDQGRCGACWAFAAVEVMTDRVCIYSNGTKNFHFSAEDLVSCFVNYTNGCQGGDPTDPWIQWVNVGIVSGGNYNSHEGCLPYSIPTCHNHLINCTHYNPAPSCVHSCEKGYNRSYTADKRHGKRYYFVSGEDNIKAEMYINGPVDAFFVVYDDFANYKGGVYQHLKGEEVGGHVVKMMGWGVENGTKYWLCANSWNTDFGENGYFKILRGVDECYIEAYVLAGEPLLEDYD